MSKRIAIIVHGGAWAIPDSMAEDSVTGVKAAVLAGYEVLRKGGSALDAVEAAVRVLEDLPVFDAGYGSVLNAQGNVEMDAMIMDGNTLRSGAVACVSNVKNPVSLARRVMEHTPHCLIVGKGASDFALEEGVETVSPDQLVTDAAKAEFQRYKEQYQGAVHDLFNHPLSAKPDIQQTGHDTVGAVAFDVNGQLACATSTGGITGKRPGRVGDSPLVGCGGFADNTAGACSSTGHGESIIPVQLCSRAVFKMESGLSPDEATKKALQEMHARTRGGRGGLVAISKDGRVGHYATTERMAWASAEGIEGSNPTTHDAGIDNDLAFAELK